MTELFVEQIPPAHPVMLLAEGYSSRYEPDTIKQQQNMVLSYSASLHIAHMLLHELLESIIRYTQQLCSKLLGLRPRGLLA